MKARRNLFAGAVLLAASWILAPYGFQALGSPDWARPYLGLPSPKGPYIAVADQWAVVFGEVEFAAAGDGLEVRHRYLLENISNRSLEFKTAVAYDKSREEMREAALDIQRSVLWRRIPLARRGASGTLDGQASIVVVAAEEIPPGRRVVWQYTLTEKHVFPAWKSLEIPGPYPAASIRFCVDQASTERVDMEVRDPMGGGLPDTFSREADGAVTVREVPSWSRLERGLVFMPDDAVRYPCIVAWQRNGPGASWERFAGRYLAEWSSRESQLDLSQIEVRAKEIVGQTAVRTHAAALIHSFVSSDVLYDDSNERGLDAWFPLSAEDSLRSMKADCKGKVLLMSAMLRSIGIASAPVLVFRSQDYLEWGPTPAGAPLNHVLLAVDLRGDSPPLPSALESGPAEGWVLTDPTLETVGFGAPPPGYEGVEALFIGPGPQRPFAVHTRVPSRVFVKVRVEQDAAGTGTVHFRVRAESNGGSPLINQLVRTKDAEGQKRIAREVLQSICDGPVSLTLQVEPPKRVPGSLSVLDMSWSAHKGLRELNTTVLCPNPCAVGALLLGIPNGLSPPRPVPVEERVTLASPWNRRYSTRGLSTELVLEAAVALPAGTTWAHPGPRSGRVAYLSFEEKWSHLDAVRHEVTLTLQLPRGAWPSEGRRERLLETDRLFMSFYQPLILVRSGSG